jgi:trimethylamine--corrinoid protein Co-methyltransferase
MAGPTDSKTVDCQAGYETMQNLMLAMLGGAQILYEALGVLDNIMTTSYEKIIIDEELYKRVSRICRGMDSSALELPLALIQEVGCGGEYLTHQSTLDNFRNMWQPTVSNWDNYSEWESGGAEDSVVKANKIWKERLQQASASYLDPAVDQDLRTFIESQT